MLLVVFIVVLGVWDIAVYTNDVRDDTISELIRDLSHDWWILPFTFMGVAGHFFWNHPDNEETQAKKILAAVAVVAVRDIVNLIHPLPTFQFANLVLGLLGFVGGAAWWPQLMPSKQEEEEV